MTLENLLARLICSIVVGLAAILAMAAAAGSSRTDELVIGIGQEPDTLDPLFGENVAGAIVRGAMLGDLVSYDDRFERVPDLAVEVPTLANGGIRLTPDGGMTTTYRIRPDARWSDGVPVTASDFIFAHEVVMDPRQPVISRDAARRVLRLEAPGPRTLVVRWKGRYAYSNDYRVLRALPRHALEPIYRADPVRYHENGWAKAPLANGPFRLESWVPGDRLTLVPNPCWRGPGPMLRRVTYRVIPSTASQIVNVVSGSVDALSTLSISLDQALDLRERWGHRVRAVISPGLAWEHIDLKVDDPLLSDPRVRKAILYGIDRHGIARNLFLGQVTVADTWLPPGHYAHRPVLAGVRYDPDGARRLLDEAGYRPGADGVRVGPAGRLALEFVTTAGHGAREQVQQIVQLQLAAIGIQVKIRNVPGKVFFSERIRRRSFRHLAMLAWTMSPISDGLFIWSSRMVPSEANGWQGQNASGWRNDRATQLLERVQTTLEESERAGLLAEVQRLWAQDLPSIPLFFRANVSVVSPRLVGWKPTGTHVPETWNIHEWRLSPAPGGASS
ncbi:MAG: peptide ABC transporter substrate-binding protein [Candidatus Riflebacteria bacterium]|nr:peptide ABC transporter substrate-binding protein [Candidatus Riflebacteria bacterium]